MSTAPRDLASIKHALELGLILATLIIATTMIVAAAHEDARKLTPVDAQPVRTLLLY
jgi:hypothetical protein